MEILFIFKQTSMYLFCQSGLMWWVVVIIEAEVISLFPLLLDSHTEATDRKQFCHLARILSYKMSSHVSTRPCHFLVSGVA